MPPCKRGDARSSARRGLTHDVRRTASVAMTPLHVRPAARAHPSRTARTAGARSTGRCRRPANARRACRDSRARTSCAASSALRPGPVSIDFDAIGLHAHDRLRLPACTSPHCRSGCRARPTPRLPARRRSGRCSPSMRNSSGLPPSCARCASSSCSATLPTSVAPWPRSLRDSSSSALIRSVHCCSARWMRCRRAACLARRARGATAAVRSRRGSPPAACAVRG